MTIVIFGLSVSSSWGNGHATLWRGLCRALARRGHRVTFFERDVPYYSEHRDLWELPGGTLVLYENWAAVRRRAARSLSQADAAIVTSYCADAIKASECILASPALLRIFYDLDTPVTLNQLRTGPVPYIGPNGLAHFDLVLSYTGGKALDALKEDLGARRVAPLYGSVDGDVHRPAPPNELFRSDLSYLGTYAQDRQESVETFFVDPARRLPNLRFAIGGAQYPDTFPWAPNMFFFRHLVPAQHPEFYCSCRLTLNVTRRAMASMGYCPSGRLFEAASCGVPIVSDFWNGIEDFYRPGEEILICRTPQDVVAAMSLGESDLGAIAARARQRTLDCHTADHRAAELENILERTLRASDVQRETVGV